MRKMSKKKAKHLLWAFDKDRNARAVLKCAVDENNTREERDRAWEDYLFYSKWRDDELLKAIGMTLEEFHNHAFS